MGFKVERLLSSGTRLISKEKNQQRRTSKTTVVDNRRVAKSRNVKKKKAGFPSQRCPPIQRSRVERLKAKVKPLSTQVPVKNRSVSEEVAIGIQDHRRIIGM